MGERSILSGTRIFGIWKRKPVSYTHLDVYKRQPKYNAAFDRCVDVMARLLQKYGPQLLEQMQETAKDGCTQSAVSGKQPVPVYQEFDKAA